MYFGHEPTEVTVDAPLYILHRLFTQGRVQELYNDWALIATRAGSVTAYGYAFKEQLLEKIEDFAALPPSTDEISHWKVVAVFYKGERIGATPDEIKKYEPPKEPEVKHVDLIDTVELVDLGEGPDGEEEVDRYVTLED